MRPGLSAAGAACLLVILASGATSLAQDAPGPKHKMKPTPPPHPPTPPRLPRARCLTPEGKPLDFEDLVRSQCNRPTTPPLPPPKQKVNGSMPVSTGLIVSNRPAPGYDDNPGCEEALTITELQRNIINATDQRCVGQILIQTGSVSGIEGGFRIDPDFNFQPNCGKRQFDPDVIALKGILLGLLQGVPDDEGVFDKVVDGVVPSFTPTEGMMKYGNGKAMKEVDRDGFAELLRNRTLLLEAFNEDPNNTPPCYKPPPPKPKYPSPSPYSPPPPPTPKPKYPSPSPYSPPPSSPPSPYISPSPYSPYQSPGAGRRLLSGGSTFVGSSSDGVAFGSSGRRLQCSDCDNADSFPCAYCWQQVVCGDLYWCQDP